MNIIDFSKKDNREKALQHRNGLKAVVQKPQNVQPVTSPVAEQNPNAPHQPPSFQRRELNGAQNQIISGYFVEDKSYKEMKISSVNTYLCLFLALLVSVCLVSYYFVTLGEIQLNKIQKETLALNYDNEEMQNKLDNLQSYYNVDKTVSKTNILGRAKQVVEFSAASVPDVNYKREKTSHTPSWSMGY